MRLYAVANREYLEMISQIGLMASLSAGPKDCVVLNSSPETALSVSGLSESDALIIEVNPEYIGVDDMVYDINCPFRDSFLLDYGLPHQSLTILTA